MSTRAGTIESTPRVARHVLPVTWVLLIYVVPSHPSRLRASIWRDLKKVGAVYLRDGVCALPERVETVATCRAIAARIGEFGGQATVAEGARVAPERAEALVVAARAAREIECADLAQEAEAFLAHVERERTHRQFGFAELEELDADLGKLKRWAEQIRARDHFATNAARSLDELFGRCEATLGAFLDDAYGNEAGAGP
ncbi:MAG: Chromate resistance protein ChrB [Thermomicrobiales bacterium]